MERTWDKGVGNVHDRGIVFLRATVAKTLNWQLKTTGIYSLAILEVGGPKSRCRQSCAPEEETSLPSPNFSWLRRSLVSLGLYLHHSKLCLCLHGAFSDGGFFLERH